MDEEKYGNGSRPQNNMTVNMFKSRRKYHKNMNLAKSMISKYRNKDIYKLMWGRRMKSMNIN